MHASFRDKWNYTLFFLLKPTQFAWNSILVDLSLDCLWYELEAVMTSLAISGKYMLEY